jgi:hypothetical protein
MSAKIVQFPTQPRVHQFVAEYYMRDRMRHDLAACVGLLHGNPTDIELFEICQRLKSISEQLNNYLGVRAACD